MACKDCGATKNLEEHHISHEPEETVMLCHECHVKRHNKDKIKCIDGKEGFHIKIDSQGKVPIPKPFREEIGVKEGDSVLVKLEESSSAFIKIKKIPREIDIEKMIAEKLENENQGDEIDELDL